MARNTAAKVAFLSCNEAHWGGSEELWARAALALTHSGIEVCVGKPRVSRQAKPIRELQQAGVSITDTARIWLIPDRIRNFVNFLARPVMFAWQLFLVALLLRRKKPDLVVVSQGGSWDGFFFGAVLARFSIPYVVICQKASDLYWPPDGLRDRIRAFITGARHVYFVSEHNRRLLEEQLGIRLTSASVARNPFLVDYDKPIAWPTGTELLRLACIGRLYPMEKGQDLLLRVLSRPKWQERPVTVDFFGEGVNEAGLREMAELLGCANARFCGHVDDIAQVWESHHGLILPSRAEGLPLVLVETMLAGRVAIVSDAGGSGEVVEDGRTAFLVKGYDEDGLDAAMERAWAARGQWPAIGAAAAEAIRGHVPRDPAAALAADLARFLPAENR